MAYAVPKQWAHGDVPTGAEMQKYSDAIAYMKPFTDWPENKGNWAVWTGEGDDTDYGFVNCFRYLYYIMDDGTGSIVDPENADNSVSLSETDAVSEGNWERIDLWATGWIYPGKFYKVYEVDACVERWE